MHVAWSPYWYRVPRCLSQYVETMFLHFLSFSRRPSPRYLLLSVQGVEKTIAKTRTAQAFQKLGPTGKDTEVDNKCRPESLSEEILCILLERGLAEESSDLDEPRSCGAIIGQKDHPNRRHLQTGLLRGRKLRAHRAEFCETRVCRFQFNCSTKQDQLGAYAIACRWPQRLHWQWREQAGEPPTRPCPPVPPCRVECEPQYQEL